MIVHDFNILGSLFRPTEADSILVVDSNGVLPSSVALQLLEAQSGKRKRIQRYGSTQLVEGSTGPAVQIRGKDLPSSLGILSIEDVFGASLLEGDDQAPAILLSV